uniref:Uncharacterized protein n=1 Tax=Mesocestoides corti TaxID=53468 RepID=A0A5K3FWW9_MESCO
MIMSTTCEEVCAKFLQSVPAPWHLLEAMRSNHELPSAFHSQHMLISLLDSPLIATPLRMLIINVLERSLSLPVGFRAFVGKPITDASSKEEGEQLTPYQRIILFLASNKSTPIALACCRLLAKIRVYEMLLEFDEFMKQLKSAGNEPSMDEQLNRERSLQTYLTEIARVIEKPDLVQLSPRNGAPKVKSEKFTSDFYPILYRLFDSIHFLDHVVWLVETDENHVFPGVSSEAAFGVLEDLVEKPSGLLFLASSPLSTARLLRFLLSRGSREPLKNLGLELAVKLEALEHIDLLIAATRSKGCQSYIGESVRVDMEAKEAGTVLSTSPDPIYDALFGLARLFLEPKFAPWVASLLSSDDFFVPCLMLFEAYDRQVKGDPKTKAKSEDDSEKSAEKCEPDMKESSQRELSEVRKSFLLRLGYSSTRLEVSSLLSIIGIGLLRHADDVHYLERFGPRLLQIVQQTPWEEAVSSLSPALIFSHHRNFSEAASSWLYWLREAPLLSLHTPRETFSWLLDQLGPLTDALERSMTDSPSSVPRSSSSNAARAIPSALLLLLRLIRGHLAQRRDEDEGGLALIELYSRNGLYILTALTECLADYLLRQPADELASEMLEVALDVLTTLVCALVKAAEGGADFRDRSPVKAVCRAYAAVVVYGRGGKPNNKG